MGFLGGGLVPGWARGREWASGDYSFALLRRADIEPVRKWRNAQMSVLRQTTKLSKAHQERWFDDVVEPTHDGADPPFLLVGVRLRGRLVAYGGLTNISWPNRRAEVSFLAETSRAATPGEYQKDLTTFLGWLDGVAFDELDLNRLFTETFAFRAGHLEILERHGFVLEGRMREHVLQQGVAVDSVLHGRLRGER